MLTRDEFLAEERRRLSAAPHDALSGLGCEGERVEVTADRRTLWLPATMAAESGYATALRRGGLALERLRVRHDFEFWAARCITITDKRTGRPVPFVLNGAQRRLLAVMERQRREGMPIRVILLKARQWGGSTLVQLYMAWLQLVHTRNRNSYICAHVKDAARTIRAMYQQALSTYPPELFDGDDGVAAPSLKWFGGSSNISVVEGRGCRLTVGSSVSQEASRGADLALVHLSEVAFWGEAQRHDPADLVRAIVSGISLEPLTLVVMESTANGVGDFFHREWLRAVAGESDKEPVFVAWHEIDAYRRPLTDEAAWRMYAGLEDPYERELWERHGAPMAAVAWYRMKRREYATHEKMMAEYPSCPTEAFANTGSGVFAVSSVEALRAGCRAPATRRAGRWEFDCWEGPAPRGRYVVGVDVGGRSDKADWSVVVVVRLDGERPAVVAQWRGHDFHDLLAQRAAAMAAHYNEGLLVVESNTLETEGMGDSSAVLDWLRRTYPNLYMRPGHRAGFQTNVATKAAAISQLEALVRDGGYVERSHGACDELCSYERRPNGSFGARTGCHDDLVMARAIAIYVGSLDGTAATPEAPLLVTGGW